MVFYLYRKIIINKLRQNWLSERKNRYDWLGELNVNIEQIRRENRVQNIYMCKKNEYFDFPEMILTK